MGVDARPRRGVEVGGGQGPTHASQSGRGATRTGDATGRGVMAGLVGEGERARVGAGP